MSAAAVADARGPVDPPSGIHFESLRRHLQDPVLSALTDLEIDPGAADTPLLGRLKGLRR